MRRPIMYLFIFSACLGLNHSLFGKIPEKKAIIQTLQMPADSIVPLWQLHLDLMQSDSMEVYALLHAIQLSSSRESDVYRIKLDWLYVSQRLMDQSYGLYIDEIEALGEQAIIKARSVEAYLLVAEWDVMLGNLMKSLGRKEEAITYLVEAVIIEEKLGSDVFPNPENWNGILGLLLFEMGEYRYSAYHHIKALDQGRSHILPEVKMNGYNTIGVCYLRMGQYDSASIYFNKANKLADALQNDLWKGIIAGNYGQLNFLEGNMENAQKLFQQDLEANTKWMEWRNVANALQWLARVDLHNKKQGAALQKLREALSILHKYPRADYLEYTLQALADAHLANGSVDSFYRYVYQYQQLHDSLTRAARPDFVSMARLQISNENAAFRANMLEAKQEKDRVWRNGLIFMVILLAIGAVIIQLNNQKRLDAERNLSQQKTEIAEIELKSAREKLKLFTQSLLDKNEAIALMEQKLAKANGTPEEATLKQLSEVNLLNDADWEKFRELFEVPYPGFFLRLRQQYPSITPSEIKMAALIRLQLSAKEMASMLGISTISIYKSRQRLRQRLGVESDSAMESGLSNI